MDLARQLGIDPKGTDTSWRAGDGWRRQVSLQLAASGVAPVSSDGNGADLAESDAALLESYHEQCRLLTEHRCPADRRVEAFLADHFADLNLPEPLRLPDNTLILGRHGVAREL